MTETNLDRAPRADRISTEDLRALRDAATAESWTEPLDTWISREDRQLITLTPALADEVLELRARVADGDRLRALALDEGEKLRGEVTDDD